MPSRPPAYHATPQPAHEKTFFGDNFVRTSGEYASWQALNLHSMAAADKGGAVHVQALPSLAEVMFSSFKAKKEAMSASSKDDVLAKYGNTGAAQAQRGAARGRAAAAAQAGWHASRGCLPACMHLCTRARPLGCLSDARPALPPPPPPPAPVVLPASAPPDEALLLGQTEAYVEYDRSGRVIKGAEVARRSKYEEDVRINNHTALWGSWWADGAWGYACCHSTVKNSYCTGKAGEAAAASSAAAMAANLAAKAARADADAAARAASTLSNAHLEKGAGQWGDAQPDEGELDAAKVAEALERLERAEAEAVAAGGDDRKRKYHSLADGGGDGLSAEEMEAYRLKKGRGADPAAAIQAGAPGGSGTDGYDLL